MVIGALFLLFGVLILLLPQILVALVAAFFIGIGMTLMAVSWRFRRMRRHAGSHWASWIARW